MRNAARFQERCQKMRGKYAPKRDALAPRYEREMLERSQAVVYGYQAGQAQGEGKRPRNPFTDKRLQKAWRAGYTLGRKGLSVKLKLP